MKIILSISGGGIRGLIPAIVLKELEKRIDKPISSCCDLIAGTSTGGIIACLLTAPDGKNEPKYTANTVATLYKQFGKTVFKRNRLRKILTIDGLFATKYSCNSLEELLHEYFGNTKLSETTTDILLPAYQISGKPYPHFFKSSYAKAPQNSSENPCVWECARSTSAANSYFKPYKLGADMTLLDGGVFANNPAMCAYAEAKKRFGEDEQIVLISLGTGEDLVGYPFEKIKHWGMLQWALPFFRQTSISADKTVDYMLRTFCGENSGDKYYNLQAKLDKKGLQMDDVSDENLARLERSADWLIRESESVISEICEILAAR